MAANQELDNVLSMRVQVAADTRALAQHYLLPEKPKQVPGQPPPVETPEFVRRMADASGAVEVICSLTNIFGVMTGFKNFSAESSISDLTFVLNTNPFWVKNATYLVPLLNTAINAFEDNRQLRAQNQPLWNGLEYHHRNAWLEILPAIVFVLKGYAEMRKVSLEMKQAFEKFLRIN